VALGESRRIEVSEATSGHPYFHFVDAILDYELLATWQQLFLHLGCTALRRGDRMRTAHK